MCKNLWTISLSTIAVARYAKACLSLNNMPLATGKKLVDIFLLTIRPSSTKPTVSDICTPTFNIRSRLREMLKVEFFIL